MSSIALALRPLSLSVLPILWLLADTTAAWAASTGDLSDLRRHALELVNEERRGHGLDPFTLSAPLNAAAQAHAEDMLARDYYAHVSPEGEDAMDRYLDQGGDGWRLVAENISSCSPCAEVPGPERVEELHQGWMDSPEHRENILTPGVTEFGFGVVAGDDGPLYAVQTFAGPGGARDDGETGASAPAEDTLAPAFTRALNARRETAAVPAVDADPALTAVAGQLLPESSGGDVDMAPAGGLQSALPQGSRRDWAGLSVLAGSCGGCGATATEGDVRRFLQLWLDNPAYAEMLTGGAPDAVGFALRAYGNGRKTAVAVLGERG